MYIGSSPNTWCIYLVSRIQFLGSYNYFHLDTFLPSHAIFEQSTGAKYCNKLIAIFSFAHDFVGRVDMVF